MDKNLETTIVGAQWYQLMLIALQRDHKLSEEEAKQMLYMHINSNKVTKKKFIPLSVTLSVIKELKKKKEEYKSEE